MDIEQGVARMISGYLMLRANADLMTRAADKMESENVELRGLLVSPPPEYAPELRAAIWGRRWEEAAQLMHAGKHHDPSVWKWPASSRREAA